MSNVVNIMRPGWYEVIVEHQLYRESTTNYYLIHAIHDKDIISALQARIRRRMPKSWELSACDVRFSRVPRVPAEYAIKRRDYLRVKLFQLMAELKSLECHIVAGDRTAQVQPMACVHVFRETKQACERCGLSRVKMQAMVETWSSLGGLGR